MTLEAGRPGWKRRSGSTAGPGQVSLEAGRPVRDQGGIKAGPRGRGLKDMLPLVGPRWDRKQPRLPKQVFFAHTLITYFDTPSDTIFSSLSACHILASIRVNECIFKPASQDSMHAANRLPLNAV